MALRKHKSVFRGQEKSKYSIETVLTIEEKEEEEKEKERNEKNRRRKKGSSDRHSIYNS